MDQYLQALREREDVSEEVLLELEERFKVVEEVIDELPIITMEERIDMLENTILFMLLWGMLMLFPFLLNMYIMRKIDEQYLATMVTLKRITEEEKQMILATPQMI